MTQLALEKVLEMAIEREARAHAFYLKLADRVEDPSTSEALRFLAREEEQHKDILNQYRRGDLPGGALSMGTGSRDTWPSTWDIRDGGRDGGRRMPFSRRRKRSDGPTTSTKPLPRNTPRVKLEHSWKNWPRRSLPTRARSNICT